MTTMNRVRDRNDLEVRWPSRELIDALGFETRVRGRVNEYLEQRGMAALSLRELMDLFLPPLSEPLFNFIDLWRRIPMLDQPQFGSILHDLALVTLTEADLGPAFRAEWAARLDRLTLYELSEGCVPKRRQRRGRRSGGG